MAKSQINAQREMALVSQWLLTLPSSYVKTTHVKVGEQLLVYQGQQLTAAQAARFASWSTWADARVVTPTQVWIVEAALVGSAGKYGQVLDYCNDYPLSADAKLWPGRAVVPIVLCQAMRTRTMAYFATLGVQTIVFQPSFDLAASLQKLFSGSQILSLPAAVSG
jgi:hypothetical protein